MLKITPGTESGRNTLLLEGRLVGPWVAELHDYFDSSNAAGAVRKLKLQGMEFVDAAGAALLIDLQERGVELGSPNAYVAGLLEAELRRRRPPG
jgi:ABC-type transporter Mla MlaB component